MQTCCHLLQCLFRLGDSLFAVALLYPRFGCAVYPQHPCAFVRDFANMDAIRLRPVSLATVGVFVLMLPNDLFGIADTFQKLLYLAKAAWRCLDETNTAGGRGLEVLLGAQLAIGDMNEVIPTKKFSQLLPISNMRRDVGLVAIGQLVTEGYMTVRGGVQSQHDLLAVWTMVLVC